MISSRHHTRTRRSQDGQSIVEFVLVLPLIVLILFAIVDFALALNYSSDLNQIAAEGTRRAAVNRDPAFDPAAYTKSRAEPVLRDRPDLAVSVCLPEGTMPGGTVRVKATVTYTLLHLIPGLESITTIPLSGRASMRLESPATFSGSSTSGPCD